MTIRPVVEILDALGAQYALVGGHALAARGFPRFTVDVDLLTTAPAILDAAPWSQVAAGGAAVDRRRGDLDDPLAGVTHILMPDGTDIDIILAKWPWEAAVIARAERMTFQEGVQISVPMTSDLILLKLAAGGNLDIRDAATLLSADRDRLISEVEAKLADVRPDVRAVWRDVLTVGL